MPRKDFRSAGRSSWMMLSVGSDTNRLAFDIRRQLSAQCLSCDEIDRAPEEVFKIELHTEVALRGRGSIEGNEDVDVAIHSLLFTQR